jgi:hypothetical protein
VTVETIIAGVVTDDQSIPQGGVSVFVMDEKGNVLGTVETDAQSGRYELTVPSQDAYLVHFFSGVGQPEGVLAPAHVPVTKRIPGGVEALQVSACLQSGDALLVWALDPSGRPLSKEQLEAQHVMTTDLRGIPTRSMVSDGWKDEDQKVAALIFPPGERAAISLIWEVDGFGAVLLTADNEGSGYAVTPPGRLDLVDLNQELARSQVRRLEENIRLTRQQDFSVPAEVEDGLRQGRRFFEDASAEGNPGARAQSLDRALGKTLWSLEDLALDRARQGIERHRKGSVLLRVVDRQGKSIPGVPLAARQVTHDFCFGAGVMPDYEQIARDFESGSPGQFYDFDRRTYERLWEAGVNTASVMLSQGFTEPESTFRYYQRYYGLEELWRMGFRLVGRELIYYCEAPFSFPEYLRDLPLPALLENQRQHVRNVVQRFQGIISRWGVTAESNWATLPSTGLNLSLAQIIEITQAGIQAVREVDPQGEVRINVSDPATSEYFRALDPALRPFFGEEFIHPFEFIERLQAAGVRYDVLSLQLYTGAHAEILGYFCPALDLATISSWLDRFAAFGKKIQVETGVNASWDPDWVRTYWHRPWDEETQAEFLRAFYTLAFSKPSVCEITWFGVRDTGVKAFRYPILNPDHTPKPAYWALKDLIRSWTTSVEGETDPQGHFRFRGFAGTYEVVAGRGRAATTHALHVAEGREQTAEILLP